MTTLAAAVERLYETFGRHRLRRVIDGCPCCVSASDQQRIKSKPLRHLTVDDLGRYAHKAMTTWGEMEDFKHFLPRLFELIAFDADGYLIDSAIGKLAYADWQRWAEEERSAVAEYLTALWAHVLSNPPGRSSAGMHLSCIARAVENLEPFLDLWSRSDSIFALRHLAEFVSHHSTALMKKGKLNDTFGSEKQQEQVIKWLLAPATSGVLEEAFFEHQNESFAGELAEAVDRLSFVATKDREGA